MDYIRLSIVIPIFNKIQFTKALLHDLSSLPINHEIIIVDNGSTDGSESICKSLKLFNLKYIKNDKNLYFAKACNIGYENSLASNVMFLNNDVRINESALQTWTKPFIDFAEQGYLVSPTVGHLRNDFSFIQEDGILANDYLNNNDYLSGWNLTASKKTYNRLKLDNGDVPFSTEFGIYFEDTDLSFRAKRLQPNIPFKVLEVPATHFGHMTSKDLDLKSLYKNARNIFINKWSHNNPK